MTDARDRFESPALRLKWAHRNLDEFEEGCTALIADDQRVMSVEYDAEADETFIVLTFPNEPPEKLRELADRIIGDLRSALDQAVRASASLLHPELSEAQLKYAVFPFADTEKGLARQLVSPKGPFRSVPPALHDLIHETEPYPRDPETLAPGNNMLCLLNNLANPQKHESLLEIGPGGAMALWHRPIGEGFKYLFPRPRPEGNFELLRHKGRPGPEYKISLASTVYLVQSDPIGTFDAPGVLRDIGKLVEKIVLDIQETTLKSLAGEA
ncbi:hypothetical protein O4H52_17325 [Sphingomonadaceae bacterium G21617-S1]|nr:hypothetical protein [Sphingomonadaceae bacterium G21617-S1]